MENKELIVKTKYEELYKTEYGYWIEHIEYEDEAETVRFEGGGCSISNEVVDKLLDRAREEGYQNCMDDIWEEATELRSWTEHDGSISSADIEAGLQEAYLNIEDKLKTKEDEK